MTDTAANKSPSAKIADLTDERLQALAFRVWRAARSKHKKQRNRAMRLAPLFRAELKLRNLASVRPAS
ncbi:hypothetical protein [Hyphococcus sp.]|jgi:hypothetical protein|uniref:hypothetical protein n=1 Tax=Hyphococcus sp. TaxID=2038636 RepID=UPI003D12BBFF